MTGGRWMPLRPILPHWITILLNLMERDQLSVVASTMMAPSRPESNHNRHHNHNCNDITDPGPDGCVTLCASVADEHGAHCRSIHIQKPIQVDECDSMGSESTVFSTGSYRRWHSGPLVIIAVEMGAERCQISFWEIPSRLPPPSLPSPANSTP